MNAPAGAMGSLCQMNARIISFSGKNRDVKRQVSEAAQEDGELVALLRASLWDENEPIPYELTVRGEFERLHDG